jgi:hypothetical protein
MVRSDVSIRTDLHFACIEQERDEVKDKKAVDKKQASGKSTEWNCFCNIARVVDDED